MMIATAEETMKRLFLCALSFSILACSASSRADTPTLRTVAVAQIFDDNGGVAETEIRFGAESVRVEGALVSRGEATDAGRELERWLAVQDPAYLASLLRTDLDVDVETITTHCVLSLDRRSQSSIRSELAGSDDGRTLREILSSGLRQG